MIVCAPAQLPNYFWTHSRRNLREEAKTFPVLLTQYCSGDEIEKNKAGETCSTYDGEERFIKGFGGKQTAWKTRP